MNLENVIENLKNDLKFSKKVLHIEEIPAREAEYCDIPNLPEKIYNFLDRENIKLFKHQCELINFIRKGKNVIITTPTASGKTLAFSLPILEKFNEDPNATALFLYPKNSLINDQHEKFLKYQKKTGISLNPFKYNRDTGAKEKKYIRENVKMLLTNSYMLHQILYWHFQWCDFYSNLKYVVIDEAHEYNGVFGSEVALLIRRLRRIANYYGSNPQFILSSATLPNPLEFSEQLVGKKFELVNKDTSSCGRKFMVFYNPYVEEDNPSTEMDTRDLFVVFIINGFQTLCFRRSNDKVEKTIPLVKKYLKTKKPELEDMIASYRAGYNPEDRKKIETKLKNKELIGITSTNALEAGIDIGSLDVVIISEYPGTCMATWQQAGRAGRGTDDSAVVFMASKDPLNQYIIKNPEFILGKPHENATIDLKNEYLLKKHVKCAAAELSVTPYEAEYYFGLNHHDITRFEEESILKPGFIGWDYTNSNVDENPAFKEQLGNITDSDFKVIHNGKIKENIRKEDAYKIAYKGAVYRNQGKFVVKDFDLENKKIELKKIEKKDIKTNRGSWKKTEVKILKTLKTKNYASLKLHFGELEMVKTFFTYETVQRLRIFKPLEVPPVTFLTKGLWLEIPEHILQKLEKKFSSTEIIKMSVNGVLSSLTAMFPYYVLCGNNDIGGHYNQNTRKKDLFEEDILFLYDTAPGGVGLVEKGLEKFPELIKLTLDMVKQCKCEDGCASCIYSNPYTINYVGKMNKKGTIFLFEQLLEELKPENDEEKTPNTSEDTTKTRSLEPKENSKDKTSLIFTLLHDSDRKNRAHAAYLLGETGNPEYVDALCKATEDIDGNVRRLSASALGKIGDKKAENSLIKLLNDEKSQVRQYAATALRKIDSNDNLRHRTQNEEESIKPQNNHYDDILSTLKNDIDSKNRAHAAYLLGETRNPKYVDALCKATEDVGNVRRCSASALGKIGDERAKTALKKLLNDDNPLVRKSAATALRKIGFKNLSYANQREELIQPQNKDYEDYLIFTLLHDADWKKRVKAAEILGETGNPEYVDALCKATEDVDCKVRRCSASALGKIGDERAKTALKKLLNDETPQVKDCAATALRKIDFNNLSPTKQREKLIQPQNKDYKNQVLFTLLHDADWKGRFIAAEILGETGNPEYVDALCKATEDVDCKVRRCSASALGKIGDERAKTALKKLLNDETPQVKDCAATALRKIDFNNLSPTKQREKLIQPQNKDYKNQVLFTLLHDADWKGRFIAAEILGETGNPEYVDALCKATEDVEGMVRRCSASALGKIGDERAKTALKKLLNDETPQVKDCAATALRKIDFNNLSNAKQREKLIQPQNKEKHAIFTLLHDIDWKERVKAAEILGETGNPEYVDALCKATEDVDCKVRRCSASALGKIGDLKAVNSLRILSKDEDQYVRQYAKKSLDKLSSKK